ncbi:hypothetical protein E2C01_055161 [Portunus trituberculatus]|uniref:Uncharacterized protein n=1 Tax=Portunus trituberculatus TaxID=210409 RepID=A0A5B7GVV7_PORTR|nr:hypothetical protein [Portunus trituberculatus]
MKYYIAVKILTHTQARAHTRTPTHVNTPSKISWSFFTWTLDTSSNTSSHQHRLKSFWLGCSRDEGLSGSVHSGNTARSSTN